MNIVMVLSTPLPPREGIGFYCTNLSRELVKRGHTVTLVTRGGSRTVERVHPEGYRIIQGAFFPVFPVHVHLHGKLIEGIIKKLEPAADVFHLHSPLVPGIKTQKPVVCTVHTPMKTDTRALELVGPLAYLARAQAPVSVSLEQALLRRAGRIAAVAHSVAGELAEYGIDPAQVAVLGNGTDDCFFTPTPRKESDAPARILYAGRLAHRKGLLDLLEAFRLIVEQHPGATLQLAGDGPLLAELQTRARRYGLTQQVAFLGHIETRDALRTLYREAAVYVQPSHYEGLPTSVLEAMSCAAPVVATGVSGHLDVIEAGRNGLLVPPKAPEHLAQAVTQLLRCPPQARALGVAARETVQARYTWPQIAGRYLEVYASVQP